MDPPVVAVAGQSGGAELPHGPLRRLDLLDLDIQVKLRRVGRVEPSWRHVRVDRLEQHRVVAVLGDHRRLDAAKPPADLGLMGVVGDTNETKIG